MQGQTLVKEKWLDARKSELLPSPYFHNVFALPHELNPLILNIKKVMLAMLFCAAKETLQVFAILPRGFMKIRYFGFLGHANKKVSIPLLRLLIGPEAKIAIKLAETVQEMMMRLTGVDLSLCPECGKGKMVYMEELPNLLRDTS